ncbi:Apoptotic chromatin condensation inducer in the nucleus [Thelohanellus kitauei]|uniref:Apoptotic chromatin condensation inducer in the nucleus n=1 Tax=Thelohanellus kitauei TaxID=669202 RepID=A0A0C2MY96_THEKT|nr:Apoptotic chromatin condensation inducer in the nucleus [Thelohanellus kitauei]
MPRKPAEKSKVSKKTATPKKRGRPRKAKKDQEDSASEEQFTADKQAVEEVEMEQSPTVERSREKTPQKVDEPKLDAQNLTSEDHDTLKCSEKQRIVGPVEETVASTAPPNLYVHVSNLVRPFTIGDLQEFLSEGEGLDTDHFWIDSIKSHCYVKYKSIESAAKVVERCNGVQWPDHNPKRLVVDFADIERMHIDTSGKLGPSSPSGSEKNIRSAPKILIEDCELNPKSLGMDELFKRTTNDPRIYWINKKADDSPIQDCRKGEESERPVVQ